jgi:hypothetical protein
VNATSVCAEARNRLQERYANAHLWSSSLRNRLQLAAAPVYHSFD